jgi:hypothetical protein
VAIAGCLPLAVLTKNATEDVATVAKHLEVSIPVMNRILLSASVG